MERRQAVLFQSKDLVLVEDYAHHPAEIRSFFKNRRKDFPRHWMKVLFQPHRYTRTKALASSFAEELSDADELQLMPTYGAFEKYDAEGTAESLVGNLPPDLGKTLRYMKIFLSFIKSWRRGIQDPSLYKCSLSARAILIAGHAPPLRCLRRKTTGLVP